ncbi:hypothetical protein BDZ89DRAFT_1078236 [Hymenopellis radicata]|nr:hypothetical protein BDZ89DRAFT_1078236 [Hymenopellis radicata]
MASFEIMVKRPLTPDNDFIRMPHTPIRRRGPRPTVVLNNDDDDNEYDDFEPDSPPPPSPVSQTTNYGEASQPRTPPPPRTLDKISAQRAAQWQNWSSHYTWTPDYSFQLQLGWRVMLSADAMDHFSFDNVDLLSLPFYALENPCNPTMPWRAYRWEDLERLACRREAALRGLPHALAPPGDETEEAVIDAGRPLYTASQECLADRYRKGQQKKLREGGLMPGETIERQSPETFRLVGKHV